MYNRKWSLSTFLHITGQTLWTRVEPCVWKKRLLIEKQPKGSNRSASQTSAMIRVAWRVLTVKNFLIQLVDVPRGDYCEECSGLKSNVAPPPWCSSKHEMTSESLPHLLQVRICKVCVSKHFFFLFFLDNWDGCALFMQTRCAGMWEQERSHLYQALNLQMGATQIMFLLFVL